MATAAEVWGYSPVATPADALVAQARVHGSELHLLHGLRVAAPLTDDTASRSAGSIALSVVTVGDTTTVARL